MKPFTQNPNTSLYLITYTDLMRAGVEQSGIDIDMTSLRARVRELQNELNTSKARKVNGDKLIRQLSELGYDTSVLSQLKPQPKQVDTRKEELAMLATVLRHLKTKRAEVTARAQRKADELNRIAKYMDADQLQATIFACNAYKGNIGAFLFLTKEDDERYVLVEKEKYNVR